jgi:antitoxin HigA-1
MTKRDHPPIHPGEVLKEEFLDPMGITAYRLAKSIGVPQVRVDDAEPQ